MCFSTAEYSQLLDRLGFTPRDRAMVGKAFAAATGAAAVAEASVTTRRRMADAILNAYARGERDPRRLKRAGLDSLYAGVKSSTRRFDVIQ